MPGFWSTPLSGPPCSLFFWSSTTHPEHTDNQELGEVWGGCKQMPRGQKVTRGQKVPHPLFCGLSPPPCLTTPSCHL